MALSSNYGGDFVLSWHTWGTTATATGTARPDDGSYRVQVEALHPFQRRYVELQVRGFHSRRWHTEKLYLADSAVGFGWNSLSAIDSAGSGLQLWGE